MATGKSCSRWFAPVVALLMVFSLSGCFDKEGDQRKAFVDFLQNTAMRSGERLPTLTAETRHLFGATQFARMKSSAIFINAGRGPVVDENALIAALQNGEIYAAGLDVFEQEPLSVDSPLLNMSNVVAVPHIGSATHETRYNMMACAVDNLIDALQGKIEKNCVNPQAAG